MNDFLVRLANAGECTVTEHCGQLVKRGDFAEDLDFVKGLTEGRVSNSEAVVIENAVIVSVCCNVDVAVVIIVVRKILIAA